MYSMFKEKWRKEMLHLYKKLVVMFHPDVCKEYYALERTKLININKNNEQELRRLATLWGVIKSTDQQQDRRPVFEQEIRNDRYNHIRTKAERIKRGFERCNLKPNTYYDGLGIKVFTKYGYITVIRTTAQFVIYKKWDGKEARVSITKCYNKH